MHYFLLESRHGLQSLKTLNLDHTKLSKNDIEALTRAMQRHMLPELYMLEQQPAQSG